MTKQEMEKAIVKGLHELKAVNDKLDSKHKEMVKHEVELGTDPKVFENDFYFNGYAYMTDICEIICKVIFSKDFQTYSTCGEEYIGCARFGGSNYKDNTNKEESEKIDKVITGLVKAGYLKVSKTKTMAKILR